MNTTNTEQESATERRRVKKLNRAEHHDLWDFWTRVLATWFATGHYHAETTAGMLMVVGETVSEP